MDSRAVLALAVSGRLMTILNFRDFAASKDCRRSSTVEKDCDRPWWAGTTLLLEDLSGRLEELE